MEIVLCRLGLCRFLGRLLGMFFLFLGIGRRLCLRLGLGF